MPYIPWNASKDLGHAVIDRDHRQLVELINQLVELMFDPAGVDGDSPVVRKNKVAAAVDALMAATAAHFGAEEAIMTAVGYPELSKHQEQHRLLLEQFGDFAQHFHTPESGSVALAFRFLREWFEYHIENYDAPLVSWLKEQNGPR